MATPFQAEVNKFGHQLHMHGAVTIFLLICRIKVAEALLRPFVLGPNAVFAL